MSRLLHNPSTARELLICVPDGTPGVDLEIHNAARAAGFRTSVAAQLNAGLRVYPSDSPLSIDKALEGFRGLAARQLEAARIEGVRASLAILDYEPRAVDLEGRPSGPNGFLDARTLPPSDVGAFVRGLFHAAREVSGPDLPLALYGMPRPRAKAPAWKSEAEAVAAFDVASMLTDGLADYSVVLGYVRGESADDAIDERRRVEYALRVAGSDLGFAPPLLMLQPLERGRATPGVEPVPTPLALAHGEALAYLRATRAILWVDGGDSRAVAAVEGYVRALGGAWRKGATP